MQDWAKMNAAAEAMLPHRYSSSVRDELVRMFAQTVPCVIGHMGISQSNPMYDDLQAAGNVGLVQAVDKFDPDGPSTLSSFAWGLVRYRILDEMRKARANSRRPYLGRAELRNTDPDVHCITDVEQVLPLLGERQQQVIRRHFLDGVPFEDVATELGISSQWARKLAGSGVVELRRLLGVTDLNLERKTS